MTLLTDFRQFDGLHIDTGPLRNVLEYQGVKAPHTGQPISEPLLRGISGGLVAGYFVFEYEGYKPYLHFLTLNTFNPAETIRERLGIQTKVKHTEKPDKAVSNLTAILDTGKPALVWADTFSLPYNALKPAKDNWGMYPIVVYGYQDGQAHISDRARVPLTTSTSDLEAARARTAKDKYRVMAVESLALDQLPAAVEAGIRDCVRYFTEEPPIAGMRGKFGLDAYTKWADLLVNAKDSKGWPKHFQPGGRMYSGLTSAYHYINLWGNGGCGGRAAYADFLEEAATILNNPSLKSIAPRFRDAAEAWAKLNDALLPGDVPILKETRDLMERDYKLFIDQGAASLQERLSIKARLKTIEADMETNFPLDDNQAAALRENIRAALLHIHDIEREALMQLKAAII